MVVYAGGVNTRTLSLYVSVTTYLAINLEAIPVIMFSQGCASMHIRAVVEGTERHQCNAT